LSVEAVPDAILTILKLFDDSDAFPVIMPQCVAQLDAVKTIITIATKSFNFFIRMWFFSSYSSGFSVSPPPFNPGGQAVFLSGCWTPLI
jgi:hypothetical protein